MEVLAIRLPEFRISIINEKNICPKYDNQLGKVSLILSNSNPVRSSKVSIS